MRAANLGITGIAVRKWSSIPAVWAIGLLRGWLTVSGAALADAGAGGCGHALPPTKPPLPAATTALAVVAVFWPSKKFAAAVVSVFPPA